MSPRRRVATVAAGALYVVAGWWLWQALELVAWPTLRALLRAYVP